MRAVRPAARVAGVAGASVLGACSVALAAGLFGLGVIGGGSMRPALLPGDVIVFERLPGAIRAGDIVVVPHRGWPAGIAHRVVSVDRVGRLRTRGDANPSVDRDPVPRSRLTGRVVARLSLGRLPVIERAFALATVEP